MTNNEKGETIVTTTMSLEKTTKGTVVYSGSGPIPSLYIKKDGIAQPFPQRVTVSVVVDEA